MENQSSLESPCASQICIYCSEKDQIIKKYQKLVTLLKRKAKRCSSYAFSSANSFGQKENKNILKQLPDYVVKSRGSTFMPTIYQKSSQKFCQPSTLQTNFQAQDKYKIPQTQINCIRKSRLSQTQDHLAASAPSAFNRSATVQTGKKVSLTSQWLKKFTELNKKINQKQDRISSLTDQIFSIKNEFLYIRSIFIQLIKALKIRKNQSNQKYKVTVDSHIHGIVNLVFNIFQYSQQQANQIFGTGENMMEKTLRTKQRLKNSQQAGNRNLFLPHFKVANIR